jgi:hypothetical protein
MSSSQPNISADTPFSLSDMFTKGVAIWGVTCTHMVNYGNSGRVIKIDMNMAIV